MPGGVAMKPVLELMVHMYSVRKFDWLHYRITRENPLTFHHLQKRELGGKEVITNGAPLSKWGHSYLHLVEFYDLNIYNRINDILYEINRQQSAPTGNQRKRIELLFLEFEALYYKELKQKAQWSSKKKYNPTLDRQKRQEGESHNFGRSKKKKRGKNCKIKKNVVL